MMFKGDARNLSMIEDGTVQAFVTSPPYPKQRVYDPRFQATGEIDPAEIGQGATLEEFVDEMVECAKQVRAKLVPTGTYWLNLGYKANGSGGAGGDYNRGGGKAGKPKFGRFKDPEFMVGQFLDIPSAVTAGLVADGWRLRLPIVWDKGGVGERQDLDHVRRPVLTHEMILMLAPGKGRTDFYPDQAWLADDQFVEPGSVWHFPPGSSGPAHLAPFPRELPRRCILLGTKPGDIVVDQFAGSGTTLSVAEELGRTGLGVDLYAGAAA